MQKRLSIERHGVEDAQFSILRHVCERNPMIRRDLTRRTFVKGALVTASAPLLPAHEESGAARLSVVCVGGHPDDPESGCGGALSFYLSLRHAGTVGYLTPGGSGISGKTLGGAARNRSPECRAAFKIMGAKGPD